MAIQFRSLAWSLALSSTLLVACGGGGSDSAVDGGGGSGGGSGGSGGGTTTGVIDRLVGASFTSPCVVDSEVVQVATGQPARMVGSFTFTKVNDTQARLAQRATYYASTDTNCTGASIGVVDWNKAGNSVTIQSSVQVPLNGATVDAYRIDVNIEAIGGISAGGTVVINQLRFPGDFFVSGDVFKDLVALSADGKTIYVGDGSEDANGYPTALDPSLMLTR